MELAAPLHNRTLHHDEQPHVRSYCEILLTISAIAERCSDEATARTAWEFYEHWKFYTLSAFDFEVPWICAARGPLPDDLVALWVSTARKMGATDWQSVASEPTLAISLTTWGRTRAGRREIELPDLIDASILACASRFERRSRLQSFEWDFGIAVDEPNTSVRYTLDENELEPDEVESLIVLMSAELSQRSVASFADILDAA